MASRLVGPCCDCSGCRLSLLPCKSSTLRLCCCKPHHRKAADSKPKATPVPLTKVIVVCSALFVNQFGINMIFPFLPFMVHDFFPYLNKTELGHKAGYLGSAFFCGNFLGSLAWGWIADRIGRRPVLLFGVAATISCELLFGFSQNFAWAIIARFMWGLLNGNVGVVKTYISEISDDTNQAKSFSYVGTCGGVARLLGSVVGGFLAQPATKYPVLQVSFFCRFPYCLPCIVGGAISLLSFLCTWLFLDETLVKEKPKTSTLDEDSNETNTSDNSSDGPNSNDSGIELLHSHATDASSALSSEEDSDREEEGMQLFEIDDSGSATDSDYNAGSDVELLISSRRRKREYNFNQYKRKCLQFLSNLPHKVVQRMVDCLGGFVTCVTCLWTYDYTKCKPHNVSKKSSGCGKALCLELWRLFKLILDRRVFLSVLLYGIIALLAISHNELLPLLLVTSHEHGGYDMDASEIGIILMVSAITQLFFQLFVFPRIAKCFGYRHTYKIGCAIFGVFAIILPFANRISGPVSSQDVWPGSGSGSGSGFEPFFLSNDSCGNLVNTTHDASIRGDSVTRIPIRVWAVIMSITVFMVFSRMIAITSVMVLISNSTLPENRGTVNGFGQSTAALGRIIGPITSAPIFAWSEVSGKGWPVNYHLMFYILAVGSAVAIVLCLLLPSSTEKKRENPTKPDSMEVQIVSQENDSSSDTEAL